MAEKAAKNRIYDEEFYSPDVVQKYWTLFYKQREKGQLRHGKDALAYFQRRVTKDVRVKASQIIDDPASYKNHKAKGTKTMIGKLYLFEYAAENPGDEETGLYDRFPLVFFFNTKKTSDGKTLMYGLNVHYLTPSQRAMLYQRLMTFKTSKKWTPEVKLKLEWDLIKAAAGTDVAYKAVHSYRVDRIQSRMIEIVPDDWQITIFLQIQKWLKAKSHKKETQTDARRKIYKSAISKQNRRTTTKKK